MTQKYDNVQASYIADMRKIIPEVLDWWTARAAGTPNDLIEGGPQNNFEARWPLGPVAHPRILHVFRTYFLQVRAMNDEGDDGERPVDDESGEEAWGVDDDESDAEVHLPIDLLVHDLEAIAPDVYDIMSNLVFVPIGEAPRRESH